MEYDRQAYKTDPTFRQLFVARSKRLTKYVAGVLRAQDNGACRFLTFAELVNDLENTLLQVTKDKQNFTPSTRVDFPRFKAFYTSLNLPKDIQTDALIVWTAIRSFLKGSIEALQASNSVLPCESFTRVEILGKNRCRIPMELRESVYGIFEKYQRVLIKQKLWDDCDRIRVLIKRIERTRHNDPALFHSIRKTKIYVS